MDLLTAEISFLKPGTALSVLLDYVGKNISINDIQASLLQDCIEDSTRFEDNVVYTSLWEEDLETRWSESNYYYELDNVIEDVDVNYWLTGKRTPDVYTLVVSEEVALWKNSLDYTMRSNVIAALISLLADSIDKRLDKLVMSSITLPQFDKFILKSMLASQHKEKLLKRILQLFFSGSEEEMKESFELYGDDYEFMPLKIKRNLIEEIYKSGKRGEVIFAQICLKGIALYATFLVLLLPLCEFKKVNKIITAFKETVFAEAMFYSRFFKKIPDKPCVERMNDIVKKTVVVEEEFVKQMRGWPYNQIDKESVLHNVRHTANFWCEQLDMQPVYKDVITDEPALRFMKSHRNYTCGGRSSNCAGGDYGFTAKPNRKYDFNTTLTKILEGEEVKVNRESCGEEVVSEGNLPDDDDDMQGVCKVDHEVSWSHFIDYISYEDSSGSESPESTGFEVTFEENYDDEDEEIGWCTVCMFSYENLHKEVREIFKVFPCNHLLCKKHFPSRVGFGLKKPVCGNPECLEAISHYTLYNSDMYWKIIKERYDTREAVENANLKDMG